MKSCLMLYLVSATSACALDAGAPYGELEAELEAHLAMPADRDAGGGWQRLDNDFQILVEELIVTAADIELVDAGGGELAFDPANPPPGYSLCHNGHCHSDDGRLVSYEEISGELSESGGAQIMAILPVGDVDMISGDEMHLACEPSCDLPRGRIGLAALDIQTIRASGLVRDGREQPRLSGERSWSLVVDFADAPLSLFDRDIDVSLQRSEDPHLHVTFLLSPSVALWDGLAWDELAGAPNASIELSGDAAAQVVAALAEQPLASRVVRGQ